MDEYRLVSGKKPSDVISTDQVGRNCIVYFKDGEGDVAILTKMGNDRYLFQTLNGFFYDMECTMEECMETALYRERDVRVIRL